MTCTDVENANCWSLVGMDAVIVNPPKPTMMLNLSDKKMPDGLQKNLTIHMFGHALGLEHEHQRSDFLEVVMKFINKDKMKKDPMLKKEFHFWLTKKSGKQPQPLIPYDPESIMHYR